MLHGVIRVQTLRILSGNPANIVPAMARAYEAEFLVSTTCRCVCFAYLGSVIGIVELHKSKTGGPGPVCLAGQLRNHYGATAGEKLFEMLFREGCIDVPHVDRASNLVRAGVVSKS